MSEPQRMIPIAKPVLGEREAEAVRRGRSCPAG